MYLVYRISLMNIYEMVRYKLSDFWDCTLNYYGGKSNSLLWEGEETYVLITLRQKGSRVIQDNWLPVSEESFPWLNMFIVNIETVINCNFE